MLVLDSLTRQGAELRQRPLGTPTRGNGRLTRALQLRARRPAGAAEAIWSRNPSRRTNGMYSLLGCRARQLQALVRRLPRASRI